MSHHAGSILLIIGLLLSACSGTSQTIQAPVPISPIPKTSSTQALEGVPTSTAVPAISQSSVVTLTTTTPDTDPAYYFGGLEISLDNAGQTVPLKKGQNFLLSLGDTYQWNVTVQPAEILSRNMKITPGVGEQGLFIARANGKAILRAVGIPMCRLAQPPCTWPDVLFQIQVLIE